ncbi:unnamed protein product, partial [Polarella glacialis]
DLGHYLGALGLACSAAGASISLLEGCSDSDLADLLGLRPGSSADDEQPLALLAVAPPGAQEPIDSQSFHLPAGSLKAKVPFRTTKVWQPGRAPGSLMPTSADTGPVTSCGRCLREALCGARAPSSPTTTTSTSTSTTSNTTIQQQYNKQQQQQQQHSQ